MLTRTTFPLGVLPLFRLIFVSLLTAFAAWVYSVPRLNSGTYEVAEESLQGLNGQKFVHRVLLYTPRIEAGEMGTTGSPAESGHSAGGRFSSCRGRGRLRITSGGRRFRERSWEGK